MSKRKPRSARSLTPVEEVDVKVASAVALDRRRKPAKLIARFAELGDQPPLILLSVGVAAVGALRRNERLARTGLRMLAAHSLATMTKRLGKGLIDRTRPDNALRKGRYRLAQGDSDEGRLRSMPSGHSAGSTALAIAATSDYPRVTGLVSAGTGAVMLAQLPSKNHFLSDVVAGAGIGTLAALVAQLLVPPFEKVRPERSRTH